MYLNLYLHMLVAAAGRFVIQCWAGRVSAATYVNNLQNAFVWR